MQDLRKKIKIKYCSSVFYVSKNFAILRSIEDVAGEALFLLEK